MKKSVSPKTLYPMITIESIDPNTLKHAVQKIEEGVTIPVIEVIDFRGYYLIWNGDYEMLAANIVGKSQVDIEIISCREPNTCLSEEKIEKQLKTIGMNALYDFEALGGFEYLEYPIFYKRGE